MTDTEAISRVRSLLNEATAGFWSAGDLVYYIDTAMNVAIQAGLAKLEEARKLDMHAESSLLQPLLVLSASSALVNGTQEYALDSDFLTTGSATYKAVTGGSLKPAIYAKHPEVARINNNSWLAYTADHPAYYIKNSKIGFYPIPTWTGSGYAHNYYKKPTALSGSGVEIPVKVEAHDGIVLIAYHYGLLKEKMYSEADAQFQKGIQIINSIA